MKINLFTNNVSRYQTNGKAKQKQPIPIAYQSTKSDYMTKNVSPNFTGLFSLGKKKVANAIPTAEQLIKRLEKMFKTDCPVTKKIVDNFNEKMKELIDDETTPFVHNLINKINLPENNYFSSSNSTKLDIITGLAGKYKKYPQSRTLIEKVIAHFEPLDANYAIFGDHYNGSEAQNKLIEMMTDAKDLDGSPRFSSIAIERAQSNVVPEKVIKLLFEQTTTNDTIDFEKMAQIIGEETDSKRIVQRLKEEAIIQGKETYLIDINGSYLARILENYTPEKHSLFIKSLQLVKEKVLSMDGFVNVLKSS